ncbi:hypothetical protein SASPL_139804 [Salvia splendens]|uniref:Pectinesterase n=1 Tax=Salvia splendens TaxID=180675 RepID=A0A8X8WP82_SALSN|nr:hypothetical protein SASPL_139804 [Salvia splendens]
MFVLHRCLVKMASLMRLQLVTSFITVANILRPQREATQRQLDAEKEKNVDGPRLIDHRPDARHAIGALVYDDMITHNAESHSTDDSPEVHISIMLKALRIYPFPTQGLCFVDAIWDYMAAMKDWKCIIGMLLVDYPSADLDDEDATNLTRLLFASVRKAVGEWISPDADNRNPRHTKAQKKMFENSKCDIMTALLETYPRLLRKFMPDKDKVVPLVQIICHMNLKGQEQNFKDILKLIIEAYCKHEDEVTLRAYAKAFKFCASESRGELQVFGRNQIKCLDDDLVARLKPAMKVVVVETYTLCICLIDDALNGGDKHSLLVILKRVHELHFFVNVPLCRLYQDLVDIRKRLQVDDKAYQRYKADEKSKSPKRFEECKSLAARSQGIDSALSEEQLSFLACVLGLTYLTYYAKRFLTPLHISAAAMGSRVITVAQDGSGDCRTVQEAIDAVPLGNACRTVIRVAPGVYRQPLYVPKTKNLITLAGIGPEATVLTWQNTATSIEHHQAARVIGTGTFGCGSTIVEGEDFIAENITFENSAPQDTLYLHHGKQYLRDCYVEGSVDFIFGNSTALLEHCHIHCKSDGFITAQSRKTSTETTGYIFLRCVITGNGKKEYTHLGRPWGPFGRVVFAYSYLDACVKPVGWHNWGKVENERSACFYEYKCFGPGSCPSKRVTWCRELIDEEAEEFVAHSFIDPDRQRPWLAPKMAIRVPYSA